jgi:hypothetical protein
MVEKVIRLSVIVPFFNVERYAAENLKSLSTTPHQASNSDTPCSQSG